MSTQPTDPHGPPPKYEVVASDTVYEGRIATVRRDKVKMPDGNVATREVVVTSDAVAIVAMTAEGEVCLIKQYRHPQKDFVWELPAGRMDVAGESPLETAKRELAEEVGLAAREWSILLTAPSSPGVLTERIHTVFAKEAYVIEGGSGFSRRNEEKDIVVEFRPIAAAIASVRDGSLCDAKTALGLLLVARQLGL